MKRIVSIFVIAAAMLALGVTAMAQKQASRSQNARFFEMVKSAKAQGRQAEPEAARPIRDEVGDEEKPDSLIDLIAPITGTWNCTVPPAGDVPGFSALQTFGLDGTFVETSSLLGQLAEGPAHGAYERSRNGYNLTFELFIFDPGTGESVGRVRVRAALRMLSSSFITAQTAVDFIEPDGAVIPNIGDGPYSCTKLRVRSI